MALYKFFLYCIVLYCQTTAGFITNIAIRVGQSRTRITSRIRAYQVLSYLYDYLRSLPATLMLASIM